ncbi:MAG: hypothetical protein ACXWRE_16680 [Pseudobdellovibrionaceae bacterium]
MKPFSLFSGTIALALVTACSPHVSLDSLPFGGNPNLKSWPEYSEQQLSGKVFGQDWKAMTAIARPLNDKEIGLEFYPDVNSKACTSSLMSSKPYATVVIPAAYTATEYVADMSAPGSGNPMVFSVLSASAQNVVAEKTKVRINSISGEGFNASVFAKGTDVDGSVSEINGKIDVKDCAKGVDFSVWDELLGWYTLGSFDGMSVATQTAILDYDSSDFYNDTSKSYLKALTIPLYYSVGQGSSAHYNFGPLDGLGTTSIREENGIKTYKYSYHGPVKFKGMDITMNLDLTVAKYGNKLDVTYTLEVPSYITITTHSFTLTK